MYVSVAYDDIYSCHPHAHSPDLFENDLSIRRDAETFGIRKVTDLFGMSDYVWEEPQNIFVQRDEFTEHLIDFYAKIRPRRATPSVLVNIPNAYLSGSLIYSGSPNDAALVYETNRVSDRVVTHPVGAEALAAADHAIAADPAFDYLHFGSSGSFNYGHFLVDDLPRIKAAFEMRRRKGGKPIKILVPSHGVRIDHVRWESMAFLLGEKVEYAFYDPNRIHYVPSLYFPTPISHHPLDKSGAAIGYLRTLFADRIKFAGLPSNTPKRLFVARPPSTTRSLCNVSEVSNFLAGHGFVTVDPGEMRFIDQAHLFANADIVIGTMGAAMTNTLFSKPGTRVGYLAPTGWIEAFYLDLATVCDHRYRVAYGPLLDTDNPPHLSRFEMPLREVGSILHRLL